MIVRFKFFRFKLQIKLRLLVTLLKELLLLKNFESGGCIGCMVSCARTFDLSWVNTVDAFLIDQLRRKSYSFYTTVQKSPNAFSTQMIWRIF